MVKLPKLDPDFAPLGKRYHPVFAGKTDNDEKIIVYKNRLDNTFHIQRPDGEFWALGPDSEVIEVYDMDRELYHISIKSSEWTGTAKGGRADLLEAEAR